MSETPELEILKLEYEKGKLDITAKHPIVAIMAEHFDAFFDEQKGINYVELQYQSEKHGKMTLLVQCQEGLTPAQKNIQLEAQLAEAQKNLDLKDKAIQELGEQLAAAKVQLGMVLMSTTTTEHNAIVAEKDERIKELEAVIKEMKYGAKEGAE